MTARQPGLRIPLPDRQIAGPATTLVALGSMVLDTARDTLYVVGSANPDGSANIVVFNNASTANGNVTPARVLKTGILDVPFSMVLDQANDRLFASTNGAQIDVYDHISTAPTGSIIPSRVISGPLTGITASMSIALDGHGRLLVLNSTNTRQHHHIRCSHCPGKRAPGSHHQRSTTRPARRAGGGPKRC